MQSSVGKHKNINAILPLNRQHREPKAKLRDDAESGHHAHLQRWLPGRSPETSENKNGNRGSLWNLAMRNATPDQSFLNLQITLQAIRTIPILLVLGIHKRTSPISPGKEAVPTFHQHCGFQRELIKAESQTGRDTAVAAATTNPTLVLHRHNNMQQVNAQIDCGATSICILLGLLRKLDLLYKPAFTSTLAW